MEKVVNKNKNKNFVIFVVFLIGIVLGFVVGNSFGKKGVSSTPDVDAELLAQVEKAKKFFPSIPEMRSVSGTVKSIEGDVIAIETSQSSNPFEELPTKREIVVTQSTRLVKIEQKDASQFQREMEEYEKKIQSSNEPLTPPSPTVEKEIMMSDIKVNDYISAEADSNIKTAVRFEAARVTLNAAVPTATPPPPVPPGASSGSSVPVSTPPAPPMPPGAVSAPAQPAPPALS